MAIDILSASRAKAADTPNARGAPPIPTFDAGKMFSQMLEQSFASRDAARQQNATRGQAATREERQAPAQRAEEPAPRPAAARTTAKERPAAARRRTDDGRDDEEVAVAARPRRADTEEKTVDGETDVAARPGDDPPAADDGDKPADDQANQAATAQVAATLVAPVIAQPKAEAPPPDADKAADDATAALAARAAQTATATAQAAQEDKPADALAATLQAMTPQVTQVVNAAAQGVKAAKSAAEGLRDTLSQAESALADLLADIGGGSIVSAPAASGAGGQGAGAGGQPGAGLLDGAAWSLMQQAPGVAAGATTQAMSFAGLLQAGLAAVADAGVEAAPTPQGAAAVEATTATTGPVPGLAGMMTGIDGPDAPHATAHVPAARPGLPLPVADQVAAHLGRAIKDEVKAINVQLNPEELGRVDIRLEFGQDGRVSAHVTADNQQALDLLQRDQRALERSLTDAGLKTDNASLSFSLRQDGSGNDNFNRFAQGQGGQQGGQGQNRGGRGQAVADVTGIDAPAAARPRTIAADGALDIKV